MSTTEYLVRLKPYDPRRGFVLRGYTFQGIKFRAERGWYKVTEKVAEYLRGVHQVAGNEYSPPAFDVCTESEAENIDAKELEETSPKKATDSIALSVARDDAKAEKAEKHEPRGQNHGQGKGKRRGR